MNSLRVLTEEELRTGALVVEGRLIDASNATLFCELLLQPDEGLGSSEEYRFRVVYKPIAGERPLWDFPDGNLASRELAAYIFSEFGGFRLVPTTVLRDGPFGPGAVQQWIEIDPSVDLIALAQGHDPQIRAMALFDVLTNNTDRKFGHILINSSQQIYGCDHGVSFHREDKLRTVIWQFAGEPLNKDEKTILSNLLDTWQSLEALLSPLLSSHELRALYRRIEKLKEMGHFPYPNPEWPSLPWPPV